VTGPLAGIAVVEFAGLGQLAGLGRTPADIAALRAAGAVY
jgi:hypothetical protein